MNKEKWVNQVMGSTNGMQPAQPPADLFEKITLRINNPYSKEFEFWNLDKVIALPARRWAAAAILLLALNIGSVIYAVGQNKKTTGNPIVAEMQLESTYNY